MSRLRKPFSFRLGSLAPALFSGGALAVAGAVVCCSFPKYFTVEIASDDGGAPDTAEAAPPDGTEFDSGPSVTCNDGGLRAGESIACSCDDDGGPPADVGPDGEAGPIGY